MGRPVRLAKQKQQELRSRGQLYDRLSEFGWVPVFVDPDLGEDFIVQIYHQGRSTGITFYVQAKSVTNLKDRRKNDRLFYDLEVRDLKHWEEMSQPVALVVWDVELREGRWALIDTLISELNQRLPDWRTKKTKVRIYLPWNNTTDDAGLVQLRQSIGQRLYPLIAKDKPLELQIKWSYPDTEEGRAAREAFERFLKEGEEVNIRGEYIQELKFSEWWVRWFGEPPLSDESLLIIGPSASTQTFVADVDIISVKGETAFIPTVEFKVVKAGQEVVQLSNEHQASPLHFRLTANRIEKYVRGLVTVNNRGSNVHVTRDIIRFLQAIATGGTLRITFLALGKDPLAIALPPQPEKAPRPEDIKLLDKLCKIQDETQQFLRIPAEGLTRADVKAIEELTEIIERGKTITKNRVVIGEFKGEALEIMLEVHRQGKFIHLQLTSDESYVELLEPIRKPPRVSETRRGSAGYSDKPSGMKIQTGRMTQHVTGRLEMSAAELANAIAALAPDEYLTLKIVDTEVVEIFPDWFIREAQRLSQLLIEKFGAESVYLFGSLAWSDSFGVETDIDLAVRALPAGKYLEAVGYIEHESRFAIDVVELESVPVSLRERILREGRLLNEREPATTSG